MRSCTDHVTCPAGEQPPGSASLLQVQPPGSGTEMGDGFPPISVLPCKLLMFPALNHWSHPSQRDSLSHCQNSLRIPTAAEFCSQGWGGVCRCITCCAFRAPSLAPEDTWEERGPWMQRARQSCPTATSTVPSGIGLQPVLGRPWPPKTGCEEGQVRLGGKMLLKKLADSVVSQGYTGGSGQPEWLICPSATSTAWTKL